MREYFSVDNLLTHNTDLRNNIIVRRERSNGKNSYTVALTRELLENLADEEWIDELQTDSTLHEIIIGGQKLHFDIDVTPDKLELDFTAENLQGMFDDLVSCIQETRGDVYQRPWYENMLVVCDSSGEKKFSRHITIAGFYVRDHLEAKNFYDKVVKKFVDKCWDGSVVDPQVYGPKQSFRMVGFSKVGQRRPKRILSGHSFTDTLVSWVTDCKFLEVVTEELAPKNAHFECEEMTAGVQRAIDKLDLSAFGAGWLRGTMMVFKRISSSLCPVCERVHDSMDMFLTWRGEQVYWHCFHTEAKGKSKLIDAPEDPIEPKTEIKIELKMKPGSRPEMRGIGRRVPIRDLLYHN
jgi:hypothetical protein